MVNRLALPKALLLLVGLGLFTVPNASAQVYDVPNNDAGCPDECRQVPWRAGSDQWNGGSLPVYTSVPCTGLVEGDGTTNNSTAIQSCLNSLSAGQAALIPPGIYYVNGTITVPSNRALRGSGGGPGRSGTWLSSSYSGDTGSGAQNTTFKLGPSGRIRIGSNSTRGSERTITAGYTKGSTTLTMVSGHGFVAGDWISVFEDGDTFATSQGDIGNCSWCGEDNGSNLIQQFVRVTAVSGNTITISRPLYYTYKSGYNPGAKKITWSAEKAGVESIKLHGWSATRGDAFIELTGCLYCWVREVETYNAPAVAKANHVNIQWSHGAEVRDSYFHDGRDSQSDRNYGVALFFWNSDHKIENNILRHHRHSFSSEGGGSGSVYLYNYVDDDYTDDLSYLGEALMNHGAHPMMNLYEGNSVSHLTSDDNWGSSSHIVLFRNWLRGDESGVGVPGYPSNPDWGFFAADLRMDQMYYSVVGNVLGVPKWSGGTVKNTRCNVTEPVAYNYGCDSSDRYDAATVASILNHGNYDYVSDSVAFWDGGSAHQLKNSMYYGSKPAFFGTCSWPVFGPDLTPITGILPAKERFEGGTACGDLTTAPRAPSNLRIVR